MNEFFVILTKKLRRVFGKRSAFQEIMGKALATMLSQAAPIAIDLLTSIALSKVSEVDKRDISNNEKRDVVLDELKRAAIKEGLQISASILNLILETAVNARKSK